MKSNSLKNCTALKQNFLKYWLPVILWMGVIFWMSTGTFSSEHTSRFIVPLLNFLFPWLSPQNVDLIHELIRKAVHVAEYFILGLLLFRAFRGDSSQGWRTRWAIYTVIGVILYALSDEFHQSFTAARGASLVDVGIDSAGGILSQIIVMLRHLLRKK
jgi:VanZ family protein